MVEEGDSSVVLILHGFLHSHLFRFLQGQLAVHLELL